MKARLLESRHVFRGRIVSLDVDRIVEPGGQEVEREVVRHRGAAVILALTPSDHVVFVRQFRYAANELMLEVPAGTIDAGEDPEETARRELVEETGYYPRRLQKLAEFFPSPGIIDEKMHLFLATELTQRAAAPEEDEKLEILEVARDEALALQVGKDLRDAKTIIALSFLRHHPLLSRPDSS